MLLKTHENYHKLTSSGTFCISSPVSDTTTAE